MLAMQGARNGVCLLQPAKSSLSTIESSHQQGMFGDLSGPQCLQHAKVDVAHFKARAAIMNGTTDIVGFLLQFENDIYVATSEPHGDIEAVVTRKDAMPHARL